MFAIAALSWAIANDAYLDADLALNTSSKEIGLAAVYLAVKEICHDLIPSFEKVNFYAQVSLLWSVGLWMVE